MNSIRVLLVDDHAPFRKALEEFLRYYSGVEIVGHAADGFDAVRQTERLRPDLVFMDLTMPGMSGFEATRLIKTRHPQTRVVVLSSHTGEVYRAAAKEAHADGYIEKKSMKDDLCSFLSRERVVKMKVAV